MIWNMFFPFIRRDKPKEEEECADQKREEEQIRGMYQVSMWRDAIRQDLGIQCRLDCLEYVPEGEHSEAPTVTVCPSCEKKIRFAIGNDLADYMEELYQRHKDAQKELSPCSQKRRYVVEIPDKNTMFVLSPVPSSEVQDLRWQDFERHCSARQAIGNSVPPRDR